MNDKTITQDVIDALEGYRDGSYYIEDACEIIESAITQREAVGVESERKGYVAPDYRLRACLCGSYDVGGAYLSAGCYKCGKSVNGIDFQTAIDHWNELNTPSDTTNRIAQLEEQLKIAVEALDKLQRLGNGEYIGNSIGNSIATDALNKIRKVGE